MAVVKVHHNNFFAMNTRLETVFWGRSKADCEVVLEKIKLTVLDLENILSSFIPHSETYILNKAGKKTNIHVSDYLFNVIKRCSEFKQKTFAVLSYFFEAISAKSVKVPVNIRDHLMNSHELGNILSIVLYKFI